MTSTAHPLVTILADTQMVNRDGELETFDSFTDRDISSVDGLSATITKQIENTYLTDFDFQLDTETGKLIHIIFTSGETFECLQGSKLLTSGNEWLCAEDVVAGSSLRSVIYNPSHRRPLQQTFKQVASVDIVPNPIISAIDFSIRIHDNILVAVESDSNTILLPFKPVAAS